ncbi:MAG: PRC-barrel domain containing protein [Chloroflexi bacterium]|nr:PRC-barrel domain containing protein [Chloroflexota bacterium]
MDIPLNADVHCPDGRCGRSTFIIVNPTTETVTHLVVREQWPSRIERLVPVDWISVSTRDVIVLTKEREKFAQLDPFFLTDFVQRDVPHFATDPKLTLLWPYVVPAKRIVSVGHRQIPAGKLAIRRGARVQATDGRVGVVNELMVDPESGNITHLILQDGHVWGKKLITIPVAQIEHIEEKVIQLKLDKKGVEALPAIPAKR